MSLTALMQGPLPVTAPLVLNPLMARMVEAAGFVAGYLGGGATGYQKAAPRCARRRSTFAPSRRFRSFSTAPAASATRCTCIGPSA